MENNQDIKLALYNSCKDSVAQRLQTIQVSLASIQESKTGDTKNSAGDKYETSVAMTHLEEDKLKQQLHEANLVRETLHSININQANSTAMLGSLVSTTSGHYFIAIGIGKVSVQGLLCYCVSVTSPIGTQLLGKSVGDAITFNGRNIQIINIS